MDAQELAEAEQRDPMPEGLVERLQAAVEAEHETVRPPQ